MKYRIEWMREKKNVYWQAKQQCVVYDDESALHIMKNLQKDPKVSLIDVIPVLWQLVKLSTILPTGTSPVYIKRVKGTQPMQVTNSATIVDYFPEAFIAEADDTKGMKVVVKRFVKRVTFRANGMKSYSTVLGIEAKYDWQARIANGAEVTGYNTEKLPQSEYMPLYC